MSQRNAIQIILDTVCSPVKDGKYVIFYLSCFFIVFISAHVPTTIKYQLKEIS